MRIAIVEDIKSERDDLRRRIKAQLDRLSLSADIFTYENGTSFLSDNKEKTFNLVFLDIYMEEENGIDTARMLRQFDGDCLLVFITSSKDHALDAFQVRAMHYLLKPYTDNELTSLFDEIIKKLPAPEPYIDVNTAGGMVRLRFQEILYAEHYLHQIYIHTTDGREIVARQTFYEFCSSLADERFFQCNRGVLVNLEHAKDLNKTEFILINETKIPISRSLAADARLAFGNYLFKRGPRP